jgi:protein-disulfide isomerase
MRKVDKIVVCVLGAMSLFFGGASVVGMTREHNAQVAQLKNEIIHISPSGVIGAYADFRGDLNSPYTLVEFGDYQCPPCRAANRKIPSILSQYRHKIRFTFRNFPLTKIHPYAMRAALMAEIARKQGKFWAVHDALYNGDEDQFNEASIRSVVTALHLDKASKPMLTSAHTAIQDDLKEGKVLNLGGTPSFLLCQPDGTVLYLKSLDQIQECVH